MLKSILGGILVTFGAVIFFGTIINSSESALRIGDIIGAIVLGIGPIAGGGLMIRSRVKAKRQALHAKERDAYVRHEKEIIRLAQSHEGRISIPEIVAETSLSTDEADAVMREMTTKGYVDMQVTDSGVIVYEFYEIAHRKPLEE